MGNSTLHRRNVYVVDGLRTPFLKFKGRPGAFAASDLAVQVCRVLINRQVFSPADFSEVITGCVIPQYTEANISRIIGLRAGVPIHVPAMTVQRNCASGLQALDTASINIHAGMSQLVLAGGTEAMSQTPLLCSKEFTQWLARYYQAKGLEDKFLQLLKFKLRYLKPIPGLKQGLNDPVVDLSMGQTAENLAYRFGISRQAMDEFSLQSHQRVLLAQEQGILANEILPVYDYNGTVYSADDGVRRDTSLEKLAQLKPQFDTKFGLVTAGNSSQVSDGAAFLILADEKTVKKHQLPVLARLVDVTWAGVDPAEMGIGPAPAIAALLQRHKLKLSDIDLWEINEAFAAQVLAVRAALSSAQYCQEFLNLSHALGEIDVSCLNVDGGAIALGHPVGASGARLALHMIHALTRAQKNRGIISLCIGGGQGGAMLIEKNIGDHGMKENTPGNNSRVPDQVRDKHWKLNIDQDNIAWLSFDRPDRSVNVIGQDTLKELDQIIDELEKQSSIQGLVIRSGKPSGIVGADIKQFSTFSNEEEASHFLQLGQDVFNRLAQLKLLKVSMIEGSCLGGGCELALTCDYRIALDDQHTQVGLPEIKLGIYPGWGGVNRLIALIGVLPAMEIILKGKSVNAYVAKRLGILDEVVPARHYERAVRFYIAKRPQMHRPALWNTWLQQSWARPWLGKFLLLQLQKAGVRESHYPAPFFVVKNWMEQEDNGVASFARDLRSVAELFNSPTCVNLLYVFALREKLKAHTKKCDLQLKHIHIIGAGTMGAGIATRCAYAGFHVSIQDVNAEQLGKAIQHVHGYLKTKLKNVSGTRSVVATMDRVVPDARGDFLAIADLVIEAVPENLELKQRVFKEVEAKVRPTTLLATNTSSIPLEEISKALNDSSRLIGLHFFNPAEIMPLVEVVRTAVSTEVVLNTAFNFVGKLSALPLPVKSYPGFLVNRILMTYLLEAAMMLQENIPAHVIDKAAVEFGMPVGPIELMDRVGLDICCAVVEEVGISDTHVLDQLIEKIKQGHLGTKTGQGFYKYKNGKKQVAAMDASAQQAPGLPPAEITDRLIFRMINEAAFCLQQEIVPDKASIDAGMIFGTGFPPFRGGLYHYAKSLGKEHLVEKFEFLTSKYGERFECRIDWAQWDVK